MCIHIYQCRKGWALVASDPDIFSEQCGHKLTGDATIFYLKKKIKEKPLSSPSTRKFFGYGNDIYVHKIRSPYSD